MQVSFVLAEILQRWDAVLHFLYLIKEKQGLAYCYALFVLQFYLVQYTLNIEVYKKRFDKRVVMTIDVNHIVKLILAKLLKSVCFAHLTCP